MNIDKSSYDETIVTMFSNLHYSSSYQFYAHMIANCSVKFNQLNSPAAVSFNVNHYELHINLEQFSKFSLINRLAILKHEMLHILEGHLLRLKDRDFKDWNLSTDCAINQLIDSEHLPEVGILPDYLEEILNIHVPLNESSEFYYDLLKQNANNDLTKETLDSHEMWDNTHVDQDYQKEITKKLIETAIDATNKSNKPGDLPSKISDYLELFSNKAIVNWKQVLKNITSNKKCNTRRTIRKRNRRQPHRIDLKGVEKDRTFNVLVLADVSGSINSDNLLEMIQEVKHICDITHSEIDLIQIDTEAREPEKISKKTKIFERKGDGGTYISNGLIKANECRLDYQAVVVCTDGYLTHTDVNNFNINKPVIWLIEKNGQIMNEMYNNKMKVFKFENN